MNHEFLRVANGEVIIAIKVQPRSSRTAIVGPLGAELKIKVAAPPVESAANAALLDFLADRLRCPKGNVVLLRGATSRHKQVAVRGVALEQVSAALTP